MMSGWGILFVGYLFIKLTLGVVDSKFRVKSAFKGRDMKKLIILVFAVLLICIGVYGRYEIYHPGKLSQDVIVVIPKGAGSRGVAEALKQNGVIGNALLFRIAARIYQLDKELKAGEYMFPAHVSMYDVMQKIRKGDIVYHRFTIPEGLTSAQIARLINAIPNLVGEDVRDIPEGSMLPETYTYKLGDTKAEVVSNAQKAQSRVLAKAWKNRDSIIPVDSPEELLILASIIEKETSVPEERRVVASVFVNRLEKGMRLQTDPTVIYALTQGEGDLGRPLYRKDLKLDSPYNTYQNHGLPPTPICNPGAASIMAAANPEMTDYLFFVADGKGGHNFAKTLNEHNSNVQSWRKSSRI